jgi:hypothetical protein
MTNINHSFSILIVSLLFVLHSLKETKNKLETLQKVEGVSLDELEKQLEESRKIYSKMNQNLQGEILQNLISVILACDNDGDMILSDKEIDDWIHNIEGIGGVDIDDAMVREKIISCGRSLNGKSVVVVFA